MNPPCLPGPHPLPATGCGDSRRNRRTGPPGPVLIIVIVVVAAAVPVALIAAGTTPAAALSTAGAVTAFAIGAAHQILGLLSGSSRRASTQSVNA